MVCVWEHPIPFFWRLSLRTGRATQDEGVAGDDGYYPRISVIRGSGVWVVPTFDNLVKSLGMKERRTRRHTAFIDMTAREMDIKHETKLLSGVPEVMDENLFPFPDEHGAEDVNKRARRVRWMMDDIDR